MKKIILLNGPPSSGKDFAANFIADCFNRTRIDKFARILKERTHALYGFSDRKWDYYEHCKDIPNDDFYGLTPRKAYIGISEKYFKPMHDKYIFGKLLLSDIKDIKFDILIISDSGFIEEAEVLIEEYGSENVLLIKLIREGCNFNNDSRSYLELKGIEEIYVHNREELSFLNEMYQIVNEFVNRGEEKSSKFIANSPSLIDRFKRFFNL